MKSFSCGKNSWILYLFIMRLIWKYLELWNIDQNWIEERKYTKKNSSIAVL